MRLDLTEKGRRRFAGAEAKVIGPGGITLVSKATKLSRPTVRRGLREVGSPKQAWEELGRVRRPGGGRRPLEINDPELVPALERVVAPHTRGDPESPLKWCSKAIRKVSKVLKELGHKASPSSVRRLLRKNKFSLQANKKTHEGSNNVDRDAQFEHIYAEVERHQAAGNPVISVDAKKKELVGNFLNKGREWYRKGLSPEVNAYDFIWMGQGRATPFGIYEYVDNSGFVNIGISGDTATFAVESIRRWWKQEGRHHYDDPDCLLITCDCGGSNSYRIWLWRAELEQLATELGFPIKVCHYPPGTSKWNKIEHRLFSQISINWRGVPLTGLPVMENLIESTTTETGLTVRAAIDENIYLTGKKRKKVPEMEQKRLKKAIKRAEFHGEWNYTIHPRETPEK